MAPKFPNTDELMAMWDKEKMSVIELIVSPNTLPSVIEKACGKLLADRASGNSDPDVERVLGLFIMMIPAIVASVHPKLGKELMDEVLDKAGLASKKPSSDLDLAFLDDVPSNV